ncbi:MAG TPA: substrate-binding domain-containing protein [Bryobacteraceae bacterium]|jgi:rhamnose transport system substrate-binding protein|nr:substrate-binding domain-containing protein [Bryobacteraceae bacterium]
MRCVRASARVYEATLPNARLKRWFPNGEWMVLLALAAEIAVFSVAAQNFLSTANFMEVVRLSVELGLLALALTPVIITGGIDLSVGSMMGLCAVVFGALVMDWHWPILAASVATLLIGCIGGALNGVLIAEFKIPPLIVTLGSFSAFRGIAEGITHGAVNYSGFPKSFLFLGQGYVFGVPAQLPVLLIAILGYAVLLHRSVIGRGLYAIGFAGEGARYAGISVAWRTGLVYLLSGLAASVAAVIYVAHLGQAKSDAGTGYELDAITAVVLGGASVAGGRGTILGTVLGLFSISVLQNGLHLAALPSELTGILTGTVLVLTIAMDRLRGRAKSEKGEAIEMKNSQVAILCAAILTGALITAGANVWLVRSLKSPAVANSAHTPVIAVMPKAKGDPYFVSCRIGAEEAARELGVEVIWDGPTGLDAAKQNEIVESWITRGVDAIAVAVENQAGISTVLRKARRKGIHVLTWDADAEPDAREYFLNQATPEGIGNALTDEAARLLGGKGDFAIITGALSAANQNQWIAFIKKRVQEKHPGLNLVTIRPSDDDRDRAFAETQTILKVHPTVKLIMAISAPAVPGAGEAMRQTGRKDVDVIGLSLPGICKPYVHDGVVQTIFLWNTKNLGYLTVYAGAMLSQNKIPAGATSIQAGRLGALEISGSQIILGAPLLIDKRNIDKLDF